MWRTGSFVEDKSSAGHFSADHYSDKPERMPIGKGQFKTILRKRATQYLPSIEIFKPATWETIFTEARDLFDASPKGISHKRVRRRQGSAAVDVEDTILLVSDTDSDPDGGTSDDNNDNDLVDDSENANEELDVDDSGDENPPFNDPFDGGHGDDIFEGEGLGDGVEADMHG
jgi:hypothetical protein